MRKHDPGAELQQTLESHSFFFFMVVSETTSTSTWRLQVVERWLRDIGGRRAVGGLARERRREFISREASRTHKR